MILYIISHNITNTVFTAKFLFFMHGPSNQSLFEYSFHINQDVHEKLLMCLPILASAYTLRQFPVLLKKYG
jgi:hypothetical protein